MLTLDGKAKELYNRLLITPPDLTAIEADLRAGTYPADDVSMAALFYTAHVTEANLEILSQLENTEHRKLTPGEFLPDICSSYLYETLELLLRYGLNPNIICDGENIMENLMYLDNGYVAADCLNLLLQHDGDPYLSSVSETLFDLWDSAVILDAFLQENRHRYDSLVHGWFVLLGYIGEGLEKSGKELPLDVYKNYNSDEYFRLSELKNHRRFTFGLSHTPARHKNWSLHIFNQQTMWEVARL